MPVVGTELFGPQVAPMFLRNLIEADEPVPIVGQALNGFGCDCAIPMRVATHTQRGCPHTAWPAAEATIK